MGTMAATGESRPRHRVDHDVLAGQTSVSACARLRGDGAGVPLGGTFKAFVIAGGSLSAVSLAVMALIDWASGLGFGWLYTLGTANVVRSWMSLPTLLALGTGQVGILLGLGDHTTAVLGLTRAIGVVIIAMVVTWLLLLVLRGRLHPVGGLGVALGLTVLLFPVVQPWYVLWAVIPLSA